MFRSLKQFLQFIGNFCNCSIRIDHNNAESFENTKTIPNVPENFGTIQNVPKSQNDWNNCNCSDFYGRFMALGLNLVVVWAEPGFSGPVLLFGLNWFGV